MQHLLKNTVVCASLVAIGAFATWIVLRPRLPRGDGFTDGEQFLSAMRTRDELRLARWEQPAPLGGGLHTGAGETRPSIDVASGRVYFVVGASEETAGGGELWVATPEPGGSYATRPIRELDTPARELAPCFHDGWLYFSSDRAGGSGGLDLWRSRLIDDRFQPPENLGASVNSAVDDADPAWRGDELWFSSNRDADGQGSFDLWSAKRSEEGFEAPQIAGELQSPYDERTPTFSPDGRVVVFASNRPDGRGGYDLWRALWKDGHFLAPNDLGAPNGAGDDTGPTLADGGFTLIFSSVRDGATSPDLYRTRTRELFPVDADAFTLADFTVLTLLVLVALLAWLARRWEALDLVYKCMVASLLLHLLFLWYSRKVDVEPADVEPAGEDKYEVQLLGSVLDAVAQLSDRATGDHVGGSGEGAGEGLVAHALTRDASLLPAAADAAPGEAGQFERTSSAAPSSAPMASEHSVGPSNVAAARPLAGDPLRGPEEKFQRLGGDAAAPTLAADGGLASATVAASAKALGDDAAPKYVRVAGSGGEGSGDELSMPERGNSPAPRARGGGGGEAAAAPGRSGHEVAPATEARRGGATPVIAVLGPDDRFEGVTQEGAGALPASPDLRPSGGGGGSGESGDAARVAAAPSHAALAGPDTGASGGAVRDLGPADGSPLAGPVREEVPSELAGGSGRLGARGGGNDVAPAQAERAAPAVAMNAPHGDAAVGGGDGKDGGGTGGAAAPTLALGPAALATPSAGSGGGATTATSAPSRANFGGDVHGSAGDSPSEPVRDPAGSGSAPIAGRATGAQGEGFGAPGRQAPLADAAPASAGATAPGGTSLTVPSDRVDADRGPDSKNGGGASPVAGSGPAPGLALTPSVALGATKGGGAVGLGQGPARASFSTGGAREVESAPLSKGEALPGSSLAKGSAGGSAPPKPSGSARLYERRFGEAKGVALKEGGGTVETERAVQAGLKYIAKVQRPKGFFGDAAEIDYGSKYRDVRVGKTGLAVLAFLGAGHTQLSNSEYSSNVARALEWIVSRQDAASGHFGNSDAYSHGIATYALAECYAITHDAKLLDPLVRGLNHLLDMQQQGNRDPRKEGGWTYYYKEGPGVDAWPRASVSAWQVMALESAKVGGVEVPQEALDAARQYFIRSYDPKYNGFRYTHSPEWLHNSYGTLPASTPAAMFVLTLLGEKDHPFVRNAEQYVLERVPSEYRYRGQDAFVRRGTGNVYFLYYSTLALFARGGEPWRTWNESLKATLLPAQRDDGSWDAIDEYAKTYALDDESDKSYSTSMCVLMLEVYYRYFTPLLGKFGEK